MKKILAELKMNYLFMDEETQRMMCQAYLNARWICVIAYMRLDLLVRLRILQHSLIYAFTQPFCHGQDATHGQFFSIIVPVWIILKLKNPVCPIYRQAGSCVCLYTYSFYAHL